MTLTANYDPICFIHLFHLKYLCRPLASSASQVRSSAPTTSPAPAASSRSGIDRSGLKMLCTTLAPSRRLDIDTANPLRTEYWAVGGGLLMSCFVIASDDHDHVFFLTRASTARQVAR